MSLLKRAKVILIVSGTDGGSASYKDHVDDLRASGTQRGLTKAKNCRL